jgi:DNA repair protein RadA/Sms
MVIAVLEARCGLRFSGKDIFLNIVGGLKITEPAADLAVAAALISALHDCALQGENVFFGEIGLTGEVRGVNHTEARVKESERLGFTRVYSPSHLLAHSTLDYVSIKNLSDLVALFKNTHSE